MPSPSFVPIRRCLILVALSAAALGSGSCKGPASPTASCVDTCSATHTACLKIGTSGPFATAYIAQCNSAYDQCRAGCR